MRKELALHCFALLFVLLFSAAVMALPHPAEPFTITNSISLPSAIGHNSFAVWSGGALVVVEDRFSDSPTIRTFDRDGNEISQFTFTIPGASLIRLYDHSVARGTDGSLAIIGSNNSSEAMGGSFLAMVSPDQKKHTFVRTSPFLPLAVTLAPDGTIWVAGHIVQKSPGPRWVGGDLIRRYNSNGELIGAYGEASNLQTDAAEAPTPSVNSILMPLADGVGWYSRGADTYMEFALDGTVRKQFKDVQLERGGVLTAVACSDGGVFVSSYLNSSNKVDPKKLGIFSLDRQRGEWTRAAGNESVELLLGCDGTKLVTMASSPSEVSWIEPAQK